MTEDKDEYEEAFKLRDQGDLPGAIQILEGVLKREGESGAILGSLGGLHFMSKNYKTASELGSRAVNLAPNSQLNSQLLFLSLLNLEKYKEAIKEGRRFIALHENDPTLIFRRKSLREREEIPHYIETIKEIIGLYEI